MTDLDLANVWSQVTADLAESALTRQQQAWVRLTQPVVLIDDTFIIAAPDKFARQAFESKLRSTLNDVISARIGRPTQIAVTVQKSTQANPAGIFGSTPVQAAAPVSPAGPSEAAPVPHQADPPATSIEAKEVLAPPPTGLPPRMNSNSETFLPNSPAEAGFRQPSEPQYPPPDNSGTTHGAYVARQNRNEVYGEPAEPVTNYAYSSPVRPDQPQPFDEAVSPDSDQPPSLFDTDAIDSMRVSSPGAHFPSDGNDQTSADPASSFAPQVPKQSGPTPIQTPPGQAHPPVAPPPATDPDPNRTGGISNGSYSTFTKVENPVGAGMSRLNPRYNFDTFVIGSSNRFAHAAAVAVSEAPARAYNPLFVYGGSGLGKTHLLHAIGHYSHKLGHAGVVRYVSTEEFTNDFINSLHDKRPQAFQRRYRDVDILLIDDIQFLERAERTQEEFFHTFNTLHNANKQIVISSDRSPKQLQTLEDRLRTRFEWGLLADIQPPDLETRIAILQKKAAQDELSVPFGALEFIASQIHHSIRELEGALIRVTAYASLNQKPVDVSLAQEVLRDFIPEGDAPEVTVDQIVQASAEYFGVSAVDLKGNSRSRMLVNARQVAMYLCRELTDLSLPRIGQAFGGRDHTTVMHANRKIRKQMAERRALYNQIAELTNRLKQQGK